ncbi:uncharacterized protein [Amphiura filiformis]|uniref:uncharacterized protein n=1 Tax=Amphiura filiformis TaxID=82378 RepID=UPI003B20E0C7
MSNGGTGNPATAEDYDTSDIKVDFTGTETIQSATIVINDDSKYEPIGEVFKMTLSVIAGFTGSVGLSQSQVTIVDNDSQFYIDTDNSDTYVTEDIGTAQFTVKRRGYLPNAASVKFSTVQLSGNAVEGQDYEGISGRVLGFGEYVDTQTVDVTIINDSDIESSTERFNVSLSDPTNGELGIPSQVAVVILNDDSSGCPPIDRPQDGSVDPVKSLYEPGDVITVYCRQEFQLIGDETLFCSSTGSWLGQSPSCSTMSTMSSMSIMSTMSTISTVSTMSTEILKGISVTSIVVIAVGVGFGVIVIITVVAIAIYCQRKQNHEHNDPYYSSHLPPMTRDPNAISAEFQHNNTINAPYEIPMGALDNEGYVITTGRDDPGDYQGLYTEVS